MAGERLRLKRAMERAGMLPWGRPELRWVTGPCLAGGTGLPALGLGGSRRNPFFWCAVCN